MPELIEEKVLVAGAGGLLGCKLVCCLINKGVKVIAADINVELMTSRLLENNIGVAHQKLTICSLDITNEDDVKSLFTKQADITGAVNCTYPRNKTYGTHFLDVTSKSFNDNLSLHLGSAFTFMQQCAVLFNRENKPLSVVNVSSVYGLIAPKFEVYNNTHMTMPVEYAAIKSAIIHLNKYVSSYIKDSRFRVNSVSPGGIFDSQPQNFLEAYKKETNGKGMLDVDDVIGAIMFLLSSESKYITGQNLIVDDGFTL